MILTYFYHHLVFCNKKSMGISPGKCWEVHLQDHLRDPWDLADARFRHFGLAPVCHPRQLPGRRGAAARRMWAKGWGWGFEVFGEVMNHQTWWTEATNG